MNLKEIAGLIGGVVIGNEMIEITGASGIEFASEGHITYLSKPGKHIDQLHRSKASAVIVEKEIKTDKAQVVARNVALAFARTLARFCPDLRPVPGVNPNAAIGKNVKLGENVTVSAFVSLADNVSIGDETVIYPGAFVGEGCRIGSHCVIHPNVSIYHGTVVGNHVTLHAGAVVGADGFGYVPDEEGRHFKIKQVGNVVIGDHVDVGANACIDRAAFGSTLIKEGTKIDNLAQIAHNCSIGEHSIIVSQAGIAGSCVLGHHSMIGGQVGIADHVTLGDNVSLFSQSGVFQDIESNSVQGGSPAMPHKEYARQVALIRKLPELADRIKELEKQIADIKNK